MINQSPGFLQFYLNPVMRWVKTNMISGVYICQNSTSGPLCIFSSYSIYIFYLKGGRGRSRSKRKKERKRKNYKQMNFSYNAEAFKIKDICICKLP